MRYLTLFGLLAACFSHASFAAAADDGAAAKAPTYAEVHAVFAKNCLSCHDA